MLELGEIYEGRIWALKALVRFSPSQLTFSMCDWLSPNKSSKRVQNQSEEIFMNCHPSQKTTQTNLDVPVRGLVNSQYARPHASCFQTEDSEMLNICILILGLTQTFKNLICRPLLVRCSEAAGFGNCALFNSHRSCFQLSAICC